MWCSASQAEATCHFIMIYTTAEKFCFTSSLSAHQPNSCRFMDCFRKAYYHVLIHYTGAQKSMGKVKEADKSPEFDSNCLASLYLVNIHRRNLATPDSSRSGLSSAKNAHSHEAAHHLKAYTSQGAGARFSRFLSIS